MNNCWTTAFVSGSTTPGSAYPMGSHCKSWRRTKFIWSLDYLNSLILTSIPYLSKVSGLFGQFDERLTSSPWKESNRLSHHLYSHGKFVVALYDAAYSIASVRGVGVFASGSASCLQKISNIGFTVGSRKPSILSVVPIIRTIVWKQARYPPINTLARSAAKVLKPAMKIL